MDDYRLRSICVDLQIAVLNVEYRYAVSDTSCDGLIVLYRLAPEYPLATILNDSYAALKWVSTDARVCYPIR